MALPHYSQDQTSKKGKNFEPVLKNMFEVTILPPAGVSGQDMFIQHVNTVAGLELHKELPEIAQKYKWSERKYSGTPESSTLEVTIGFSLNLNDANQMYLYKSMREWYRLQYNPETGEHGLKKDYVGQIVVVQFNRAGDIFRKITLEDCFPKSAPNPLADGDYSSNDAETMEVVFVCNTWAEELT
jgi:hypothetical protein